MKFIRKEMWREGEREEVKGESEEDTPKVLNCFKSQQERSKLNDQEIGILILIIWTK